MLSEKDLENLAELSRIRLAKTEEKKLLGDLEKILAYVAELNEVSTDGIPSMAGLRLAEAGYGHAEAGGAIAVNKMRSDDPASTSRSEVGDSMRLPNETARAAFPESEEGFLRVPPVFE